MSRFNTLVWRRPPAIWTYGIAVVSVASALVLSWWPAIHLQSAPASLFLCAVMFSAWLGGVGPGFLAIALSFVAFDYYFIEPLHSFALSPEEIPRLIVFVVAALFVGSLSAAQRSAMESVRGARDDLKGTVQDLQKTNEALQAESLERKRAELWLAGENRLLEMIAKGDSRSLILDATCRLVEELVSGSVCSILLMDSSSNSLRHGAAPACRALIPRRLMARASARPPVRAARPLTVQSQSWSPTSPRIRCGPITVAWRWHTGYERVGPRPYSPRPGRS